MNFVACFRIIIHQHYFRLFQKCIPKYPTGWFIKRLTWLKIPWPGNMNDFHCAGFLLVQYQILNLRRNQRRELFLTTGKCFFFLLISFYMELRFMEFLCILIQFYCNAPMRSPVDIWRNISDFIIIVIIIIISCNGQFPT